MIDRIARRRRYGGRAFVAAMLRGSALLHVLDRRGHRQRQRWR